MFLYECEVGDGRHSYLNRRRQSTSNQTGTGLIKDLLTDKMNGFFSNDSFLVFQQCHAFISKPSRHLHFITPCKMHPHLIIISFQNYIGMHTFLNSTFLPSEKAFQTFYCPFGFFNVQV